MSGGGGSGIRGVSRVGYDRLILQGLSPEQSRRMLRGKLPGPVESDALPAIRFDELLPVPRYKAGPFWTKLSPRLKGECWPWKGAKSVQGYGRVKINGRLECAHRVAFSIAKGHELVRGPKRIVLHSCDNPACCNPDHLRLGTHRENVADMYERGRQPEHMKPQPGSRRSTAPFPFSVGRSV